MVKRYILVKYSLATKINIESIGSMNFVYNRIYCDATPDIPESHEEWELLYIIKGKLISHSGDTTYTLNEGNIHICRPNEIHYVESIDNVPVDIFIIAFNCVSDALMSLTEYKFDLNSECSDIMTRLLAEGEHTRLNSLDKTSNEPKTFASAQYIKSYLELLLINLVRVDASKEQSNIFFSSDEYYASICSEITKYLEKKVYENISLKTLCHDFHFGKTLLCTKFKAYTGSTIMEYYNIIRIEEAKKLLARKKYSISQISDMLSFSSPYYFSAAFKKCCGVSPKDYKESVK